MANHKILVIGASSEGALPESYARAFERQGMEVVRFDSERALIQANRFSSNRILRRVLRSDSWNTVNREVTEVAKHVRPGLIFAVKCSFFHPETVRQIRNSVGVPFVNHYPDHPYIGIRWDPREASALRRDLIEVLRQYTIVFMWEKSLVERLRRDGVEAKYLTFAVDPELFRPQPGGEGLHCEICGRRHEVVFVGTRTRARQKEIHCIARHEVAIWGNGWSSGRRGATPGQRIHAPVYAASVAKIYGAAAVSLNVLNAENLGGPNMRTFEVPGSGGVMLARYSEAQAEFFPENEAAAFYRSPEELDAKIDWLLGDAALRERIRRNALRLAASETYDHRAAEVLRQVGLTAPRRATVSSLVVPPR
jgi:spore maturation protein CgeB